MGRIELEGLSKSFGGTDVIRDVSLAVEDGEFCVFVGPSGSGKSTLLRLIAGLETATAGRIVIDGRDVTRLEPVERRLAMVFQSYALYPHMTVRGNLAFALETAGAPRAEIDRKVAEAARALKLGRAARPPPRAAFGRAAAARGHRAGHRARAVAFLFDEPLSNLDAALRVETRQEIARLHRSLGATTVYVTHDQVEAMTLADRIVVLRDGQVMQEGAPMDLYHAPANAFVAGFLGSPAMNLLPVTILSRQGGRARVEGRRPPARRGDGARGGPARRGSRAAGRAAPAPRRRARRGGARGDRGDPRGGGAVRAAGLRDGPPRQPAGRGAAGRGAVARRRPRARPAGLGAAAPRDGAPVPGVRRPVDHRALGLAGFPDRLSVRAGERVAFHLSCAHPVEAARVVRLDAAPVHGCDWEVKALGAPAAHRSFDLGSRLCVAGEDIARLGPVEGLAVEVLLTRNPSRRTLLRAGDWRVLVEGGTLALALGDREILAGVAVPAQRWMRLELGREGGGTRLTFEAPDVLDPLALRRTLDGIAWPGLDGPFVLGGDGGAAERSANARFARPELLLRNGRVAWRFPTACPRRTSSCRRAPSGFPCGPRTCPPSASAPPAGTGPPSTRASRPTTTTRSTATTPTWAPWTGRPRTTSPSRPTPSPASMPWR
jgi:multiple sugar transport system ATP-binding protein